MTSSTRLATTSFVRTPHADVRAASRLMERAGLRYKTMLSRALSRVAGDAEFATGHAAARCLSVESSRQLA